MIVKKPAFINDVHHFLFLFSPQHDGLEKRHSWFLEFIEVTHLLSKKTWIFKCSQWLSLFESDCQLSRDLKALDKDKYGKRGKL